MHGRVFLFVLTGLVGLVILTHPPLLERWLQREATPVPTTVLPTATPSPTHTPDPLAAIPTATPLGAGGRVAPAVLPPALPAPAPGQPRPTRPATPTVLTGLLPDSLATPRLVTTSLTPNIPTPPPPAGPPPERIVIPRLGLDAPVEPVGMVPSAVAPGVVEWAVPGHRAAGWLNTSAPLGRPGNTVLDGHHNIKGEVFRDLWTLQAGDEIALWANGQERPYQVEEVLILPERDQPLAVRLANARYILPTQDERLTLVTCWPYEANTHRTVVVALPAAD